MASASHSKGKVSLIVGSLSCRQTLSSESKQAYDVILLSFNFGFSMEILYNL